MIVLEYIGIGVFVLAAYLDIFVYDQIHYTVKPQLYVLGITLFIFGKLL